MLHEFSFKSFNQRDNVQAWIYVPACQPKGIIQLIHGFGEHSRRYLSMIAFFTDHGYIVAADDHVGHGKTAIVNDESWGNWGSKGYETMTEDEHKLMEIAKQKYPNLPYLMFGHSMGSFIARDFAAKYGDELDGLTICGTAGEFPNIKENTVKLEKLVADGEGENSNPEVAASLLGWMFKRCPEGVNFGNEWICHDPWVQKDHAADPFNALTKPTSNRAFLYFCQMVNAITGDSWAKKVPESLPILNIAGDQDPVGQYGTGVYQVTNWLIDSNHEVKTHVYHDYRHEIHNYPCLKEEIHYTIVSFFDEILGEDTDGILTDLIEYIGETTIEN